MTTDELLQRWSDGSITPDELRELTAKLAEPEHQNALLDDWLLESNLPDRLPGASVVSLPEARRTTRLLSASEPPQTRKWPGWLSVRPLAAAAAGIVLGMLCTSVVLGYVMPALGAAVPVLLINAGFESEQVPGIQGIVPEPGIWGGDVCAVVGAEQGIVPREGARMLRFLKPVAEGEVERVDFTVADQWMLLEARTLPMQENGERVLMLSASFNRTVEASDANNRFGVGLYAFTGSVSDGPALWKDVKRRALAFSETEVPTDNDPATWERGETRLTLPAGAQIVLLRIHAFKQSWLDSAVPELIGHYADDVRLEITPTPTKLP